MTTPYRRVPRSSSAVDYQLVGATDAEPRWTSLAAVLRFDREVGRICQQTFDSWTRRRAEEVRVRVEEYVAQHGCEPPAAEVARMMQPPMTEAVAAAHLRAMRFQLQAASALPGSIDDHYAHPETEYQYDSAPTGNAEPVTGISIGSPRYEAAACHR